MTLVGDKVKVLDMIFMIRS